MITEFYNLQENTAQIFSQVPVDAPLFQPSPKVVVYENYAPFATHEYKLYFRNNDGVSRRIKVIQPESSFFQVSAPHASNGEQLKQSKIAPGTHSLTHSLTYLLTHSLTHSYTIF